MTAARQARRTWLAVCALLLFVGLTALGSWQLQRRAWKLELIERVTQRVGAPLVDAPGRSSWPQVNTASDEYRHVRLTGRFISGRDTRVLAVTRIGSGFWLLSPLQLADGAVVLVNRGFIESQSTPSGPPDGSVTITGLLRLSEPGGGFLRQNDPAGDRWFSRDVAAIAQARGLSPVAPYFVDAAAAAAGSEPAPGQPVGGLTVIAFANSHLVYALTWYTLALMVAGAGFALARQNAPHHDSNRTISRPQ
jgi:surfeit locus 1 family protein